MNPALYWDNAATGWPKPLAVLRASEKALRECGNPGRGGHAPATQAGEWLWSARRTAADFFGVEDPTRVIFTSGCTAALNLVIHGLPVGQAVVSDLEHNAVMRPLRTAGWRIRVAATGKTDADALAGFEQTLAGGADLVVCTCASNVSGRILPVEAICRLAHRAGALCCLDAAQAAGTLPLPVKAADYICVPGHKGLYGPMGTGLLLLGRGAELTPSVQGGTGVLSRLPGMPDDYPERLEPGTPNVSGIAGLAAGIRFVRAVTPAAIRAQEEAALAPVRELLLERRGVTVYGAEGGSVLSFSVKDRPAAEVADILTREGVAVRAGLHCAPAAHDTLGSPADGAVRLSPGMWVTPAAVEKVMKILRRSL